MELKERRMRNAMLWHLLLVILLSFGTVESVTGKLNRIGNCTYVLDGKDQKQGIGLNFTQAKTVNSTSLQNSDASVTFNPCYLIEKVESSNYRTSNNNTIAPPKDNCSNSSSLCLTVIEQITINFDNSLEYVLEDNPQDADHPIVFIFANSSKTGWKVYIKMICNNTNTSSTDTLKVDVINYISMTTNVSYNSPKACWINIKQDIPGTSEAETAGFFRTFFVFVFFIFFMYFVGGMILKKLCFNAEGIELLPNHLFWINLYHTTRDAFIYLMNGCKHPSPYDQI